MRSAGEPRTAVGLKSHLDALIRVRPVKPQPISRPRSRPISGANGTSVRTLTTIPTAKPVAPPIASPRAIGGEHDARPSGSAMGSRPQCRRIRRSTLHGAPMRIRGMRPARTRTSDLPIMSALRSLRLFAAARGFGSLVRFLSAQRERRLRLSPGVGLPRGCPGDPLHRAVRPALRWKRERARGS
jgi:hypothetical protein